MPTFGAVRAIIGSGAASAATEFVAAMCVDGVGGYGGDICVDGYKGGDIKVVVGVEEVHLFCDSLG